MHTKIHAHTRATRRTHAHTSPRRGGGSIDGTRKLDATHATPRTAALRIDRMEAVCACVCMYILLARGFYDYVSVVTETVRI